MSGSREIDQVTKKVKKYWELASISEIVVKRYNLIRQAIEIYFDNSRSAFINFYRKQDAKRFMGILQEICKLANIQTIQVVKVPEKFFADNLFTDKWIKSELTTFDYIMLLNKYGGRTFQDISQYPVFPWILKDYSSDNINIQDETVYRSLKLPIAGISKVKQQNGDIKLSAIVREEDTKPFQFGTHYLPARYVLGYLFRTEPFATQLIKFDQGQDSTDRMFHSLREAWNNVNVDMSDNKELIPEFFYSPEIFFNFNHYSFGVKKSKWLQKDKTESRGAVRVDQIVLPPWGENPHIFIKTQALALESKTVSLGLNNWIDLIFGIKQQDPKTYNLFNDLCDEREILKRKRELLEKEVVQIQEFGTIPIKLFRQEHPAKDIDIYTMKRETTLFSSTDKSYSILCVANLAEPIVMLKKVNNTVLYAFLMNQKICKSKEDIQISTVLSFDKRLLKVGFTKSSYIEPKHIFNYDSQRRFAFLDQGAAVLYGGDSHHFLLILNSATNEILFKSNFHNVIHNIIL